MDGIRVSSNVPTKGYSGKESTTYVIQPPSSNHHVIEPQDTSNYIIDTNKNLQTEVNILRMEKLVLEKDKENSEDEQDKLEEKNRYLKGLLKNFAEMDKMYKKISSKRQEMLTISKDNHNYQMKNIKKVIQSPGKMIKETFLATIVTIVMQYSFLFMTGANYNPYISTGIIMITQAVVSRFAVATEVNNILEFPNFSKEEKYINDILKEIKETETSQDYVNEFIDCI
tara:strand:- start:10498 stop:11178 length:681 start_codon:yes stop_codon:yes gene_type:complete